ncbi:MAG TPA: 2Fe-2S iron-sulfur cluster-binding protein [Polyangiaceae bacterium]|jgi:ferredoxin|nr:MAG: Na(+)-translocating NADH-quinone reductase subunit F [Deltaproteobacteria bacterium ADurb.Bin207]HNT00365.1 2Fe-2S iron-sulfur cluster-binding protein [Polyangiaceae bacterium]HNZ22410.1 2Fe-2S iron-sulfur cluster-binding protein [Polyangiaceae bacterium]HOD20945.1 2Fe-2S iron-sulfur cluster-binding protein [Polyangiaceae bacterium]HOE48304.1 2Fe-2S iron-sulfur cluster-binding protein [Polyangiaceae bacterium]
MVAYTVCFIPSHRTIQVSHGTSLLEACHAAGLPLASSCDRSGICRACRVQIVAGEDNLCAVTRPEQEAKRQGALGNHERLACLARVQGPVTITTTYW